MKILVAYGSHLGSTAAIAERIGSDLTSAGLDVIVQPAVDSTAVEAYDAFVIGGGTYGGRWHPDAVAFIRHNAEVLVSKPVWLFSSGPLGSVDADQAREPVEMAELAPLVGARGHIIFAGAHDRSTVEGSELGRLERFIAKRFIPEGDWRDWPTIDGWARSISAELQPTMIGAL